MAARMPDLDSGASAGSFQSGRQLLEPREEAVVENSELVLAMAARRLGGAHLDGDQAGAALGPGQIVPDELRRHRALRRGEAGRHRRHHDPVGDVDATDRDRLEQPAHIVGHAIAWRFPSARMPAMLPGRSTHHPRV
jgi:hypothetical protein